MHLNPTRLLLFFFPALLAAPASPSACASPAAPSGPSGALRVTHLTCAYRTRPLGIDRIRPLLGWQEQAGPEDRGRYQTAYQIQVASSPALLTAGKPDMWDSRKTVSGESNNIGYGGRRLRSGCTYYWRVRVWDEHGTLSTWSRTSFWTMGLLKPGDWKGSWITDPRPVPAADSLRYGDLPAPLFRREFSLQGRVSSAMLHISGLGFYIARINGKRVGRRVMDPAWTDYAKRVFYSTYDVTGLLQAGGNCIGVTLGNGWYNPLPLRMWGRLDIRKALPVGRPRFILQLDIRYADGRRSTVVSDGSWNVADGPVLRNSIYLGETYDARRELPGWDLPGGQGAAANWRNAIPVKGPGGALQAEPQPPVTVADTLLPRSIRRTAAGRYIVDFGRNFAGIIRLKAAGPPGTQIRVRYGELLYPEGTLNVMTAVAGQIKHKGTGGPGAPDTAYACDRFILNGKGRETFQPRFTFHGFRYAEISGYPGKLSPADIRGLVLHAAVPAAGTFACSDTLVNRIQQACRNTFLSNLFGVQSDCPHRERFGYGGDMVASCEAFMDNFGMARFYAKAVQDFADAARPGGGLTETAPYVGISDAALAPGTGPVEWGSVLPVLLWRLYEYYGNRRLIRREYPLVKGWVDFLKRHADSGIITTSLGDWESLDPKENAVSATAFYYFDTRLAARFAGLLHKKGDSIRFAERAGDIRSAFIHRFFDPATGFVGIHTASTQAYALYFGLVPVSSSDLAMKVLLRDIHGHGDHVTTGMFGAKYMAEVLSAAGHGGLMYRMVNQTTFPGWGYMLSRGATTIWEHWAFSDNTYSHNHPMFGSISQWFYRRLAGLMPDSGAAGYDRILIRPDSRNGLRWAKATCRTMHGLVETSWKKEGGRFSLHVVIPVNSTARIFVPCSQGTVTEGGRPAARAPGLHRPERQGNYRVFSAGSGTYDFVSEDREGQGVRSN